MHDHAKTVADGLSLATVLATFAGWLPALAALASLIWTVIRVFESRTVQNWLHRHDPNWVPIKHKDQD